MRNLFLFLFLIYSGISFCQEKMFISRSGTVEFLSETPVETIYSRNDYVSCAFDPNNGDLVFQINIISFKFEKALMQEHFHEKYMETDKYPKSTFIGIIENWNNNMLTTHKEYNVTAKGVILIHGVEKEIEADGSLVVDNDKISISSNFNVRLDDFNIKVPKIVAKNIADIINIDLNVNLFQQ